jgi:hypothetical protein
VLGLRNQIGGDEFRIAGFAEHDGFGGACQKIDRAIKGDQFLGCRHVGVSRSDNFVDAQDRLRAVGEGGDCLRTAYAIELADAEHSPCGKDLSRGLGRDDAYVLHSGDLGGNNCHQQR